MSELYSNFAGSSIANLVFIIGLGVLNYLRKRLNKSKCKSDCYIFDCEAQLLDLKHVKHEVQTQRGMLTNLLEMIDAQSQAPIVLAPRNPMRQGIAGDIENPPHGDD